MKSKLEVFCSNNHHMKETFPFSARTGFTYKFTIFVF